MLENAKRKRRHVIHGVSGRIGYEERSNLLGSRLVKHYSGVRKRNHREGSPPFFDTYPLGLHITLQGCEI